MFDIGWTELLVLAIVAILVVGPKELPRMLYALGQTVGKLRRQADEFRRQFNESMREAGMDEIRNDMKTMSDLNPTKPIRDEIEGTFRDQPKSVPDNSSETGTPHETESSVPRSEGEIMEESEPPREPAAKSPDGSATTAENGERKSVNKSRATNGAAEAKDVAG